MTPDEHITEFVRVLEHANCSPRLDEHKQGRILFSRNQRMYVLGIEPDDDFVFFAVAATLFFPELDDRAMSAVYMNVADQLNRESKLVKIFTITRDDEIDIVVAVEHYGDAKVFEDMFELFMETVDRSAYMFVKMLGLSSNKPSNGLLH